MKTLLALLLFCSWSAQALQSPRDSSLQQVVSVQLAWDCAASLPHTLWYGQSGYAQTSRVDVPAGVLAVNVYGLRRATAYTFQVKNKDGASNTVSYRTPRKYFVSGQ